MAHQKLKNAIFNRGIKVKAVAAALGISTRALYNKIEGRAPFLWREVVIIQDRFFPDFTKEDLFVETDKIA